MSKYSNVPPMLQIDEYKVYISTEINYFVGLGQV
jgi:hypothetical protein